MITTNQWTCREIALLLQAHGVRHAVVSPGSRNSPLIMALARTGAIECHAVIDERSAAFTALGISATSSRPVAVVCTSGTALLNLSPAVAEAYYRRVPLIVISADRPEPWIDQDDSQTIRQPGCLSNFVMKSYNFNGNPADNDTRWQINRQINEGMLLATGRRRGPVHFNIALGEPLTDTLETGNESPRIISRIDGNGDITTSQARQLASELASKKILITVGFNFPDSRLNRALQRLAKFGNIVVAAEATANLHGPDFVKNIDATIDAAADDCCGLKPDIVISTGGGLVSRKLKEIIRAWGVPNWRVGRGDSVIDCFKSGSMVIDAEPALFFQRMASAMQPYRTPSDYAAGWLNSQSAANAASLTFDGPWSDLTAIHRIMAALPDNVNLHVSNGMTLRNALSAPVARYHRIDCNRGVSGIDGSTSTAVGAASVYQGPTILLTGDMSAQYDIAAMSSPLLTDRFKMIVIANGDGGIFRVIKATRDLPELDSFIACKVNFPASELAAAYGFEYFEATGSQSLADALNRFLSSPKKAVLAVITDSKTSAEVAHQFIEHIKNHRQ